MTRRGGNIAGRVAAAAAVALLSVAAVNGSVRAQATGGATEPPSWWPPSTEWLQEQAPQWNVDGSNTLRYEVYDITGDESTSPFAFEGPQVYDELQMSFSRDMSPWETVRGDLQGLINFSDYRLDKERVTLERFNVTWEKGDSPVPFRIEGGDYFGFFSVRTLATATSS